MIRLLIVEDELIVRNGLINSIDWDDHNVEVINAVSNGVEATRLIEENKPDVVLADIRMPGMDGLELTRWIRERYPDIYVILLTGFSEFEYARCALKLEVVDYLLKPVDETALFQILGKIEDKKEKRKQNGQDNTKVLASRQCRKIIEEIKGYIENNYMNEINLKSVSEKFYINSSYLCRLFSSDTGSSFSEFLNKCRIEKSMKLLNDSRLKIYHISEIVGYKNEKYYARVFKKFSGISPYEYREKYDIV
jgi:YesN/AraC family two-component response regulator